MILLKLHKADAETLEYSASTPKAIIFVLTLLRFAWKPSHGPATCELHGLSRSTQKAIRLQFGDGWENFSIEIPDCSLQSDGARVK